MKNHSAQNRRAGLACAAISAGESPAFASATSRSHPCQCSGRASRSAGTPPRARSPGGSAPGVDGCRGAWSRGRARRRPRARRRRARESAAARIVSCTGGGRARHAPFLRPGGPAARNARVGGGGGSGTPAVRCAKTCSVAVGVDGGSGRRISVTVDAWPRSRRSSSSKMRRASGVGRRRALARGLPRARRAQRARGAARHREAPPDLVLLDLVLPDMNGLDVLRGMKARRSDPRPGHDPVVPVRRRDEGDRPAARRRRLPREAICRGGGPRPLRGACCASSRSTTSSVARSATWRSAPSPTRSPASRTGASSTSGFMRSSAARTGTRDPVSLIMIDLDHFKTVNDRHGHPAGDAVLREAAAVVRASIRDPDICCTVRRRGVRGHPPEDPPARRARGRRADLACAGLEVLRRSDDRARRPRDVRCDRLDRRGLLPVEGRHRARAPAALLRRGAVPGEACGQEHHLPVPGARPRRRSVAPTNG